MPTKTEIWSRNDSLITTVKRAYKSITGTDVGNSRALDVSVKDPQGAFGSLVAMEDRPRVQIDAVFGLRGKTDTQSKVDGVTGVVDVNQLATGSMFRCQTGTDAAGFGRLRSVRALRYKAGQGSLYRFTALFTTGVANSSQRVGAMNDGVELTFGYNGADFGILHRTGGICEVRTLTLTVAAAGAETATVTLDDVEFTPALTAGTLAHNAFELASFTYAGWEAHQNGATVIFLKVFPVVAAGAYSFSSPGAAVGTFAQVAVGIVSVDTWIPQADWNRTTLRTEEDPFILDPTKGNVYTVIHQYLGFGGVVFAIGHPRQMSPTIVHQIEYNNKNIVPSLHIPIMKLGVWAENLGNTSNLIAQSGSGAGFLQGENCPARNVEAFTVEKTGITTTLTAVLSIRSRAEFDGRLHLAEILPLIASIAVDGAKPARVEVILNATLGGEPNWTYLDQTHSTVETDVAATTAVATPGVSQRIGGLSLSRQGNGSIDMRALDLKMVRGDTLTIAVKSTVTTTDATVSCTWQED